MSFRKLFLLSSVVAAFILSGCASSQMKQRKEQRDRIVQSAKLYCDFVNGEIYPDVEVQLNLEMAKHCDSSKNFSISNYKTSNENVGVVYCCAMASGGSPIDHVVPLSKEKGKDAKAGGKKDDKANDGL